MPRFPSIAMRAAMACAAMAAVAVHSVNATACQVDGTTIDGNTLRYLTGAHGVDGSIYAHCINGEAKCFADTRVRDHAQGEQVPCDAQTIHASRRQLGVFLSDTVKYWPRGVACYTFGSTFTAQEQAVFATAMNEFATKTSVRFVPLGDCAASYGASEPSVCGGCTQGFRIVRGGGASDCYATLGYAPSQRMDLNFDTGCFTGDGGLRVAIHELGHILGLIHEHTHPSRAVVVLRDSLSLSADNYMKETNGLTTSYDPNSVMHYGRDTGLCVPLDKSLNYCDIDQTAVGNGCVEPTTAMCDASADASFGRGTTLSAQDIATLTRMYGSGTSVATPAPSSTPASRAPPPPPTTPVPPVAPVPASPGMTPSVDVTPTVTPMPALAPEVVVPEPDVMPAPPAATEPSPEPTPTTHEPVSTPTPTVDDYKQQPDATDGYFHQFSTVDTNADANNNVVAADVLPTGAETSAAIDMEEQPAMSEELPRENQPMEWTETVESAAARSVDKMSVVQVAPLASKSQASGLLMPTQPKGKLCT